MDKFRRSTIASPNSRVVNDPELIFYLSNEISDKNMKLTKIALAWTFILPSMFSFADPALRKASVRNRRACRGSARMECDALCSKTDGRRNEMRRTPIALIALVTSVSALNLATPARAASVCLAGGSDNTLRCDYSSFEQCRASASGGLGYCVGDPASVFNAQASYRGSGKRIIDRR